MLFKTKKTTFVKNSQQAVEQITLQRDRNRRICKIFFSLTAIIIVIFGINQCDNKDVHDTSYISKDGVIDMSDTELKYGKNVETHDQMFSENKENIRNIPTLFKNRDQGNAPLTWDSVIESDEDLKLKPYLNKNDPNDILENMDTITLYSANIGSNLYCEDYTTLQRAYKQKARLTYMNIKAAIVKHNGLFQIKVGPFDNAQEAKAMYNKLVNKNLLTRCALVN